MRRKRVQCVEMDLFQDQPGQGQEKKEAVAVAQEAAKAAMEGTAVKRARKTGQLSLFEDYDV